MTNEEIIQRAMQIAQRPAPEPPRQPTYHQKVVEQDRGLEFSGGRFGRGNWGGERTR